MKILIATGIYPPDIGGPAQYAYHLRGAFASLGHTVQVCSYRFERRLPFGVRQCVYVVRLIPRAFFADVILTLDTVSTGFPASICARLFRKKYVVRVGGDFVWETFCERTSGSCPLPRFYTDRPQLTMKEKLLARIQAYVVRHAHAVAFNSEWLRDIWAPVHRLSDNKTVIIENYCLKEGSHHEVQEKVFLGAGRTIQLKNGVRLHKAFSEAQKIDPSLVLDVRPSSPEEFSARLTQAWAVIVPSVSEVSPNVIFEAVSHKKPFIVTKYNGLPSRFGPAGITVDPYSVEDIRDAILTLARTDVHKQYTRVVEGLVCDQSWPSIAKQFISICKV